VRAAPVVPGRKTIQTQHAEPAPRELIEGRTANAADSKHDYVKCGNRHAILAVSVFSKPGVRQIS
jgi:hypothetical protein